LKARTHDGETGVGMAGRYTGSYLDQFNGWRAKLHSSDASPKDQLGLREGGDNYAAF